MEYHELEKTTVSHLREMAQEYPDVTGASGMSKETLIDLLCEKMGIEKPHKVVVGMNKPKIKAEIRVLKVERAQALEAKNKEQLRRVRRKLHRLRHKLRKAEKVV